MGREMVKLSWVSKTFVPLQFYHLIPLLLQCLISLFARSLAWLFDCFLFVCFVFSSFLRFWLTGWLTDRLTYILPCWFSFFLFHFLFANSFLLFLRPRTSLYLPTNIFILLLKPSLHPCARSSLLLHAISTLLYFHPSPFALLFILPPYIV